MTVLPLAKPSDDDWMNQLPEMPIPSRRKTKRANGPPTVGPDGNPRGPSLEELLNEHETKLPRPRQAA